MKQIINGKTSEAIEWAERRQIDPDQLPEDLQPEEA